jgi:hypothetical protein
VLLDRLENQCQLTNKATDYTHNVLFDTAVTINIDQILEHDALLGLALLYVVIFNLLAKLFKLLSFACGFTLSFPLGFGSNFSLL